MAKVNTAARVNAILNDLKNGVYRPVYFLSGEEPYYIDVLSDYIEEHALQEHEREFNQTVMYGIETNPLDLVSAVKRYPMMAERQVVILKEAQRMKDLDKITPIIKEPVPTTILVICYKEKKVDQRTAIGKLIAKETEYLVSEKIYEDQLPSWIREYCRSHRIDISQDAQFLLADHIGSDLQQIVGALDKLKVALPEGDQITPELIEKHIGISKDFNVFELQKALGMKNAARAVKIAKYMAENQKTHPLMMINATLFGYFNKIYMLHHLGPRDNAASVLRIPPFYMKDYQVAAANYGPEKIERIFSYMREADLKGKGVHNPSTDAGSLLLDLVFKILN